MSNQEKQPLVSGPQTPSDPPPPYSPQSPRTVRTKPPRPRRQSSAVTQRQREASTVTQRQEETRPKNYISLSIITTLFCCWVCGLVALVMSLQVDCAWKNGDTATAKRRSAQAKKWNAAAVSAGAFVYTVVVGAIIKVAFKLLEDTTIDQ